MTPKMTPETAPETPSAKSGRHIEIDFLKAFTILFCMIPVHVWQNHTDLFDNTFTLIVDSFLGGFMAAPVFMFCMGMGFVFTRHNSPGEMSWRGVKLLTYGAALSILTTLLPYLLYNIGTADNIYCSSLPAFANQNEDMVQSLPTILTVDIMQLAGLSFLLFALLKKMKLGHWAIFGISVAMCIAGSLAGYYELHAENSVVNHILGLFFCSYKASCFPLFTWFIFISAGNLFGLWYKSIKNKAKVFSWLIPVGAAITAAFFIIQNTAHQPIFYQFLSEEDYYGMPVGDALAVTVFIPLLFGIWWLLAKLIPARWSNALTYPSRHINQYYCVSWVWISLLMGVTLASGWVHDNLTLVLDSLAIILLVTLTVYVYNRFLKERWEAAISRHKFLWMSVVWSIWLGSIVLCNI